MSSFAGSTAGRPSVAALTAAGRVDSERAAVAATAAAVAVLPLVVPRGPGNLAPADAFLAVAITATLLWAWRSAHRWRFPYALAVGALVAGGALGALAGPVPTAGLLALIQDLVLLAWCWAVVNISHSAANLKILLAAWAYSAIAWAVLLYVGLATGLTALTGQIDRQGTRVAITFGDPNYAANYIFVSIMIVWATARPRRRELRLLAYALLIPALILTGSNAGIVSLLVGVAIAAVFGVRRRFGVVHAATALAFLLIAAFVIVANVSLEGVQDAAAGSRYAFLRDGIGRNASEAGYRELLAREGIRLYETGGLAGSGPTSTKVRLNQEAAPYVKEAHDDYLAALIERGAVGLFGLLLLVGSLGIRTLRAGTTPLDERYRAVLTRPNALVGAMAGMLVAGTAYELYHARHVWTLFALPAAISIWGLARSRPLA